MDQYHIMLALLIVGFLLLGFGFNYREHEWGVRLMSAGIVVTLAPIAFRLYLALQVPG
ncbi:MULTISPECIES: hypothetical protein [Pseudomonas]|jgi:hypothetical protein|uniref:hypothetical protein n=1 Tax=Pseudomonas TaxID=286 RepID=UPI001C8109BB|nr:MULTISPECIES: hypothetical protein [Pseudomonas]MDG9929399.1 hypothetical protein [Pseudomonas sp. GD04042]MDH0481625.1 hypothetical protein [Pseudomonas sp. GD04015]MDH0602997.1 hypothetical protein [Pseudomonas sp. GD03869]MDH0895038.1 hypothetical protein [Pseudomonas sp. GD03875]MDH1065417.1 hypothetical protein [Pseudomonas sp. GD03985]